MRLSTKGRYAVMAMVDLAQHSGGDPVSLADVCERRVLGTSGRMHCETFRGPAAVGTS